MNLSKIMLRPAILREEKEREGWGERKRQRERTSIQVLSVYLTHFLFVPGKAIFERKPALPVSFLFSSGHLYVCESLKAMSPFSH